MIENNEPPMSFRGQAGSFKKRGGVPPRTITLPASLRAELVESGALPPLSNKKSKLGRKDKRKAARNDGKQARAEHFANKKRKAEEVAAAVEEEEEEEEEVAVKNVEPEKKKQKTTSLVAPVVKTTALERLLAKQQRREDGVVDPKRKKNLVESTEDQEIAWLEAKLGIRGGPPVASEKGKWKEEFFEDGLDGSSLISFPPSSFNNYFSRIYLELFAGIDDLESAAFGKSSKVSALLGLRSTEQRLMLTVTGLLKDEIKRPRRLRQFRFQRG